MVAGATLRLLLQGEILFQAGDRGDAFYLIESGAIELFVESDQGEEVVARLGPGEAFGEQALRPGGDAVRALGARAATTVQLAEIARAVFSEHAARFVFAAPAQPPADVLKNLALFRDLEPGADDVGTQRFRANDVVVRQGDPSDAAYFIVDGYARALWENTTPRSLLGRFGPGQCFGELGVLEDAPRRATVEAETELVVLRVEGARFRKWYQEHPPLRDLLSTISHVYGSKHSGITSTVMRGTYEGSPAITSIVRRKNGRSLVTTKLEGRDVVILASADHREATEAIDFERAPPGTKRTLFLAGEHIEGARLEGPFGQVATLSDRILNGRPITRAEKARFRWTGITSHRANVGKDRLVCGCVGLSQEDFELLRVEGCDLETVVSKTGATSICGSCSVPLSRGFETSRTTYELPPMGDHVVSAEELEVMLEDLGSKNDPLEGLLGPKSVTWKIWGESLALFSLPTAILMELAHPVLGEALSEHSAFFDDPRGRFHRTLSYSYGIMFGGTEEAKQLAREVHEKHARVVGTHDEALGEVEAAREYSANDTEALLWVAATLIYASGKVHEEVLGPLTMEEKDRLIDESRSFFMAYGIPPSLWPRGWAGFEAYMTAMLESNRLVVGTHARRVAKAVLGAPRKLAAPMVFATNYMTTHWMPRALREAFGLRYGRLERAIARTEIASLRAGLKVAPRAVRTNPVRLHAERRIAGNAGPHPIGRMMVEIACFLSGRTVTS